MDAIFAHKEDEEKRERLKLKRKRQRTPDEKARERAMQTPR